MSDELLQIDRDLADAERRIDTVAAGRHTGADRIEIRNLQRHVMRARASLDAKLAPDPAVRNLTLIWSRAQAGRSKLGIPREAGAALPKVDVRSQGRAGHDTVEPGGRGDS